MMGTDHFLWIGIGITDTYPFPDPDPLFLTLSLFGSDRRSMIAILPITANWEVGRESKNGYFIFKGELG